MIPFFNVHLDYVDWGPRALRNGASVASVIESENRVRTSAMEQPIEAMTELIDDGYPVFLTGDFNEPSSLDYTEETVGTRDGITEPVPWPVSEELFDLGFRDSYREVHPDPVEDPGVTHRSGERIDLVYAAGPSTTLDSKLVGEPGAEDVEIEAAPWTSDHFAVLSSFEVTPVAMPTLVAVDAALRDVGDEIAVTHNAPESGELEIAIVPEGGDPAEAVDTLAATDERGTATLDTSGWDPGAYDAVLTDDDAEVARVSFYLRDPQAELELSTDRRSYRARRAGRGRVGAGARQPLGLAGGLQGLGVGSRRRRLPDLGLHRRTCGGHRPADHRRRGRARPGQPGRVVAASRGRLRRPLPARRPVRVGRQRRVQRSRRRTVGELTPAS